MWDEVKMKKFNVMAFMNRFLRTMLANQQQPVDSNGFGLIRYGDTTVFYNRNSFKHQNTTIIICHTNTLDFHHYRDIFSYFFAIFRTDLKSYSILKDATSLRTAVMKPSHRTVYTLFGEILNRRETFHRPSSYGNDFATVQKFNRH